MTIKAITFDFWATLYHPRHIGRLAAFKGIVEQETDFSLDMAVLEKAATIAWQTWDRIWVEEQRTLTAVDWVALVHQELPLSLPDFVLSHIIKNIENSALANPPALVADVKTVIPTLAQRCRLAVISDTGLSPGRVLQQVLARDALTPYFSHLTFSDVLGHSKPHPNAFLRTLEALEVRPEEAFHVGDLRRTDIAGAQGVGMRGVQFIGVTQDQSSYATPDATITKHTELMALLDQWAVI